MYNKNYPNYKLYLAGIITENQYYESIDVSEIWNKELPDNLKPLMRSVGNYNRYSDKDTLFYLLPKYDDLNVQLDAHGLAKISLGFQIKSLIEMLKRNKAPNHTAPLTNNINGVGSGLGASTAYRDGAFIVVASFGKELKDGIKYVIVDGKIADIKPIEGKTATQILQQELGQGGKYEFIDGGENNNQLDAFFAKFPKPKSNKKQLKDKQPEVYSKPKPTTTSKTSAWDEPPPIINSLF